jgi:hypothetical protein
MSAHGMSRICGSLTAFAVALACFTAAPAFGAARLTSGKPGGVIPHHKQGGGGALPVGSFFQNQRSSLRYWGGPVLRTNETFAIFWDPAGALPPSYRSLISRYLQDVAADSGSNGNVYSVLDQYYDTSGPVAYSSTFAGSAVDTDPFPTGGCPASQRFPVCITDQQLGAELDSFLFAHGIARPGNRAFVVLTPAGVNSCFDSSDGFCLSSSFCAYHGGFTGGHGDLLYANVPYQAIPECDSGSHPSGDAADATINAMSHEHRELIDDPYIFLATDFAPPLAWYDPFGAESSDHCEGWFGPVRSNGTGLYNQVINGHQYLLQTEWSNALAAQSPGLGCVGDASDQPPTGAFTSTISGANVSFDASGSSDPDQGDTIGSYVWLFGDGNVGFGVRPKHRFASAGTYDVRLQVTDRHGASTNFADTVTVKSPTPAPTHAFQVKLTEALNGATFVTTGSGSATGLGKVSVNDLAFFDYTNFPASADVYEFSAALTTAKGDRLSYSYVTTLSDVTNPPQGNNYTLTGQFVIEGGTGQFANATGSGTITGTCTSSFTSDVAVCTERWDGKTGGF